MKKILFIIIDGLGDQPIKELGGQTPLEKAHTPNLDFLAKDGLCGILCPISRKIAPESDQAMLSILGYLPLKYYTGRGPLEALGSGIKFKKGEVVLRCNFAEIKGNIITNVEAKKPPSKLIKKLNEMPGVKFIPTVGHRAVLILEGSPKVTNTHPGYKIISEYLTSAQPIAGCLLKEKKCRALSKEAEETAQKVNEFIKNAKEILKDKTILTRGAGNKLPELKKMKNWLLIADMPVEIAIGKLSGMKIVKKPTDFKKLVDLVKKNIKSYNIYLQIKGPDTFGHQGLPQRKRKSIEKIDKKFISKIKNLKDILIIITADHSTPCQLKAHSKDPLPILIYDGIHKDNVRKFGEKSCQKGSLGHIIGIDLMKIVLKMIK
jgi:2,3-bisphosphoglycerate-independent phosphoglycerate mutase